MNKPYHNQLILQTVIEVNNELSHLENRLSQDVYLEVGDDPRLTREIENQLLRIIRQIKTFNSYFDLSQIPLSQANKYFSLTKCLNDALDFLNYVKKKEFGSRKHTQELLTRLRDCSGGVNEISEMLISVGDIVH